MRHNVSSSTVTVAVRVRKTCLALRWRRILPLCRWARCRGPHGVWQTLLRSTRVSILCERGVPVCSNGPGRPPLTWVRAEVATVGDTTGATLAVRCGASRLAAPARCSDASWRCTLAPPGGARPRSSRCWRRSNSDTSVLSGCGWTVRSPRLWYPRRSKSGNVVFFQDLLKRAIVKVFALIRLQLTRTMRMSPFQEAFPSLGQGTADFVFERFDPRVLGQHVQHRQQIPRASVVFG